MTSLRLPSRAPTGAPPRFVPLILRPVLVLLLSLGLGVVPLRGQAADTATEGLGTAAGDRPPAAASDRLPGAADTAVADDRHPVRPASGEVAVDGRLDEPAWREAEPIRLAWESSPGENEPAPVATACRVIHDADRLYVGCRADDADPDRIRAHLTDRDEAFDDDGISVLLDTFGDRRRGYEFRVNPLGVQMDALYRQGSRSYEWDGIWDADGRITDEGYVVELAIPFRTLSFPESGEEQSWGVVLERTWPRSETHEIRSFRTDYDERCLLCQADRLVGLRPGAAGHGVEVTPTVTTSRTDRRESLTAPRLQQGDVEPEIGVTGTWRFASNMQLGATVNPDFSQVEADAARLTTNRRFAIFFPEKRPFFQERSDIFEIPTNPIFTRSVVDPSAGLKLTGKAGDHTVGAFVTRDEVTSLLFPGPRGSARSLLEQETTGGVGRWQLDVGSSSSVGGALTVREGPGYHNRVGIADGEIRLGPSTTMIYVGGLSHTDYPDDVAEAFGQPREPFTGYVGGAAVSHGTRSWDASLSAVDIGPDYRADAGFLNRVGVREANAFLRREFWTPDLDWATRFALHTRGRYTVDHDGELVLGSGEVLASWLGPGQTRVALEADYDEETFAGRRFALPHQTASVSTEPSGALSASVFVTRGKTLDVANARRADLFRIGPDLEWRAGRHLSLELSHDLRRLSRGGAEVLEENVTELRGVYHFSLEAFLRAIVQRRDVSRDPARFGEPVASDEEGLFGQFLFSYELNPRTALFLGYTDSRAGLETDERRLDLRQNERTFFLKMSYAWRP